jgi:hypothetical protein
VIFVVRDIELEVIIMCISVVVVLGRSGEGLESLYTIIV